MKRLIIASLLVATTAMSFNVNATVHIGHDVNQCGNHRIDENAVSTDYVGHEEHHYAVNIKVSTDGVVIYNGAEDEVPFTTNNDDTVGYYHFQGFILANKKNDMYFYYSNDDGTTFHKCTSILSKWTVQ